MAEDIPQEEAEEETGEKKKRSKKKLLIPVLVLLLGLGGGGFFFTSSKKAKAAEGTTTTTEVALGKIVRLSPITMNLSDGHVLKVGIALQLVAKPKDKELAAILAAAAGAEGAKVDATSPLEGQEAKALDQAIMDLGNKTYAELSAPGGRGHAKEELTEKITHTYEGDVTAVYFTDFVMS